MHGINLLVELLEGDVVALGRLLEFHALGQQVVVGLDRCRSSTRVDLKGDVTVPVGGIAHKVLDHTQQLAVGFQFDDGAVAQLLLGDGRLDLQLGIDNLVAALVGLDFGLAAGQTLVDDGQALIDELGGVDGLFVLLLLSALVVQVHEHIQDVDTARLVVLGNRQVDTVGLLVGQFHLDAAVELFALQLVAVERRGDVAGLAALVALGRLDGKHAVRRLHRCRQSGTFEFGQDVFAIGGLDCSQALLVQVNLELEHRRQRVKHLFGGDDLDRGTVVVVPVGHVPRLTLGIGAVQFQALHDLGAQVLGRENNHLVIDLAALAHEFHALEQAGTGSGTVVVLGYQHYRLDVINALGILQVEECQRHACDQ